MNITPKQYAIGLYEATKDLPKNKTEEVIKKLVKILKDNKHLGLEEKIIEEYNRHLRKQKNITQIKIRSNKKISTDVMNNIVKKFDGQVEIIEAEDKNMIGGIILEVNENTLIDGSVNRKLASIKKIIN